MERVINVPPMRKVTFYAPVKLSNSDDFAATNRKVIKSRTYQDNGPQHSILRESSHQPQRVLISRSKGHSNVKVVESGEVCPRSDRATPRKANHNKVIAGGKQIKTILRCDHVKEGPVWGASSAKRNLNRQEHEGTDLEVKKRRIDRKISELLQGSPSSDNSIPVDRTRKVVSDGRQLKTVLMSSKVTCKSNVNPNHGRNRVHEKCTDSSDSDYEESPRRYDKSDYKSAYMKQTNPKKLSFDKSCKFCVKSRCESDSSDLQSERSLRENSDRRRCPSSLVESPDKIKECPFCNKYTYQPLVRNLRECCHCCVKKSCDRQSENIPPSQCQRKNSDHSNEHGKENICTENRRKSLRSYLRDSTHSDAHSQPRSLPSYHEYGRARDVSEEGSYLRNRENLSYRGNEGILGRRRQRETNFNHRNTDSSSLQQTEGFSSKYNTNRERNQQTEGFSSKYNTNRERNQQTEGFSSKYNTNRERNQQTEGFSSKYNTNRERNQQTEGFSSKYNTNRERNPQTEGFSSKYNTNRSRPEKSSMQRDIKKVKRNCKHSMALADHL